MNGIGICEQREHSDGAMETIGAWDVKPLALEKVGDPEHRGRGVGSCVCCTVIKEENL